MLFVGSSYVLFAQNDAQQQQLPQPKIVALPRSLQGEDPLKLMKTNTNINSAATAIKQVLSERQLELADLEGSINNYDELRASMKNLASDPNALIASAADADIYFEFTIELIKEGPTTKAKVILNVREAATAKVLGTSEGVSPSLATNDISSLCSQAVNNCIERVLEQVRAYWSQVPKFGKPVMLIINSKKIKMNEALPNNKYIDGEIEEFLTNRTKSFRASKNTDNTIEYNPVYVDYQKYSSPGKLGREIREFFIKELGMTKQPNLKIIGKSIRIEIE